MCEEDHLLPDFRRKFIPTLSDFVQSIDDSVADSGLLAGIEALHKQFATTDSVSELMLSPLMTTGQMKSLLITHNSWFVNHILPKIYRTTPFPGEFSISPADLFNSMHFEPWMDNGEAYPPSARLIAKNILHTEPQACPLIT